MAFKFLNIFLLFLVINYIKVDTASFKSSLKLTKSLKPDFRNFRDAFTQISVWGNSSKPSAFNSLLNSSNLSAVASDPIIDNIPSPVGLPNDFGLSRPMKSYQRFKNFNLRLGPFFHLHGVGAVYHHQTFH